MILSVCTPHGGYDKENYITELETVKVIMVEGKKVGAKDFFIGGHLDMGAMIFRVLTVLIGMVFTGLNAVEAVETW